RLVPGYTAAEMLQALRTAIADDGVGITWQFNEPYDPPASPLRAEVCATVTQVARRMWPGVVVIPGMETGMGDARILRAAGIPSSCVFFLFIDHRDVRAHVK